MKMNTYLMNIDKILRFDDELWKLMYYRSTNSTDDPLDKESIFDLDMVETAKIINHRLKYTPTIKGLDEDKVCRIFYYPSRRRLGSGNWMKSDQDVTVDIFVPGEFNDVDMRLSKICDRVNELLFNSKVSNLGKTEIRDAREIILDDIGYMGYRMVYSFGSLN